jgi:hypothetical protein
MRLTSINLSSVSQLYLPFPVQSPAYKVGQNFLRRNASIDCLTAGFPIARLKKTIQAARD